MRELLMIHALDERDLLRSRIMGKIGKTLFLITRSSDERELQKHLWRRRRSAIK